MLYTYSFARSARDLTDILMTVIKDEPRFISNFNQSADAAERVHTWQEDALCAKFVKAESAQNGVIQLADSEVSKLSTGALLVPKDDSALFRVESIDGTTAKIALIASNGSTTTEETIPDGCSFNLISVAEREANGSFGENYNVTQTVSKNIAVSGNALAIVMYGNVDNQINRATAFSLAELARDLNRMALYGARFEATNGIKGRAGGLYYFATGLGELCIDAEKAEISSDLLNDAAQMVVAEGGEPMQILCSPGQARIISYEYKDRVQVLRSDDRRGAYVSVVVNEINGRGMKIVADPDVPDTDVWVLDPTGFGLSFLRGKDVSDRDTTPPGFDGIIRTAEGELTFEFRNAKQRCCRIKNLKNSWIALEEKRK